MRKEVGAVDVVGRKVGEGAEVVAAVERVVVLADRRRVHPLAVGERHGGAGARGGVAITVAEVLVEGEEDGDETNRAAIGEAADDVDEGGREHAGIGPSCLLLLFCLILLILFWTFLLLVMRMRVRMRMSGGDLCCNVLSEFSNVGGVS